MNIVQKKHFKCVGFYEHCDSSSAQPDRYRWLLNLSDKNKYIAEGSGLSLSGASFSPNALTVNMRKFDRILSFDPQSLTITAESGITLQKLFQFLISKNLLISIQPGYPLITLGGCIAGNVHGKNHYKEGIFSDIVEEINLFHPSHGVINLSRNNNGDLFHLTCGGFGLTGIILSAKIKVKTLEKQYIRETHIPINDLISCITVMNKEFNNFDFMYSWHDLSKFSEKIGRGFIVGGKRTDNGTGDLYSEKVPDLKYAYPFKLFNRKILPIINYFFLLKNQRLEKSLSLYESMFPFVTTPMYFYAYGKKGFFEHQVLIPEINIEEYIEEFIILCRNHKQQFGLVSLKKLKGSPKMMWYTGNGFGLSLHLPTSANSIKLVNELDNLNSKYGGRPNIIKDPRLSKKVANNQFENIENFRKELNSFDPKRLFVSMLSERLHL